MEEEARQDGLQDAALPELERENTELNKLVADRFSKSVRASFISATQKLFIAQCEPPGFLLSGAWYP